MDFDKLRALVELSRLGTMAKVARATGYGTSAVSQQLAALERETGTRLLEPVGRGVRLTPAGQRLANRGAAILADITAAQLELSGNGTPSGRVRIAGHTTALRMFLLPVITELAHEFPEMRVELMEGEPPEVVELLDDNAIDLGFVYDFSTVPRVWRHTTTLISESEMVLAVPDDAPIPDRITSAHDLAPLRDLSWIGNSRDSSDDELSARLCAPDGWIPTIRHRADSLDLVVDLITAGQGVSVFVADAREAKRVRTVSLDFAPTTRRTWALVRAGTTDWPATTAIIERVRRRAGSGGKAGAGTD